MSELYDCRNACSQALFDLANEDSRVVVVCNDSVGSAKLTKFREEFPNRLINIGIAEQNMMGIGAGLANGGKLPFVVGASCFLTARALEQIKVDVAYSNANVKICGVSSGVAYGPFGATHHSLEDIAWTRVIANMTVIVPADPVETEQAVCAAAQFQGPVFIRTSRIGVPIVHDLNYQFEIGKASCLKDGDDLTLIANGTMTSRALEAASLLADSGIQARVINMATVQPIDRNAIIEAVAETKAIITIEEHTIYGGLGSAVAEIVVQSRKPIPMRILGVPGVFAPTGTASWIFEHFGLTPESIGKIGRELLEK